MKRYLAFAFIAVWLFGYAVTGDIWRGAGMAFAVTLIGGITARFAGRPWGTASMAALLAIGLVGRWAS